MSLPATKRIAILGGGTNCYISNHFAVSAPAYGQTAIQLAEIFREHPENKMAVDLILTKMADPHNPTAPDTPEDVEAIVDKLIADPATRVIVFNVAMVDYQPEQLTLVDNNDEEQNIYDFGKYNRRLSSKYDITVHMTAHKKIIQKIRKERKDILLVGFKTTCGATKEDLFDKALKLCKDASANIVFANDVCKERIAKVNQINADIANTKASLYGMVYSDRGSLEYKSILETKLKNLKAELNLYQNNGLVTPEESSYWYNTRQEALQALAQMALDRTHLHFTRSTVVDSETVPWLVTRRIPAKIYTLGEEPKIKPTKGPREVTLNPIIPVTFRTVFDWVRAQGGYKQGPTGATVGHFGIKLSPNEFLTSKRKTDFNKIEEVGLVRVITDDPDNVFGYKHFFEDSQDDKVIAFGAKPSVGGQSQRSLFDTYPELDCIIHFHCPLKTESRKYFNTTPQFSYECGSKECIASNITGFQEYRVSETHSIWAGHMDYHGPNIVFSKDIDPQVVINFINQHWDLSRKTDGLSEENK